MPVKSWSSFEAQLSGGLAVYFAIYYVWRYKKRHYLAGIMFS